MVNLTSLAGQTKIDLLRYLSRETSETSIDEFKDKLRVLIIIVLCTQDRSLLTDAMAAVKQSNPDQVTPQLDTFLK